MSSKPSIPARPSAKPALPQKPVLPSKPAFAKPAPSAKPSAQVRQAQGTYGASAKAPAGNKSYTTPAGKATQEQRTPSKQAQGNANRTPLGRGGGKTLPVLNPGAVTVDAPAVGVSRSPQANLLPPADSVARVRPDTSSSVPAASSNQRAVVKVARVKRGKSSDGAKRVGPSGLPSATAFKPKQPPGIGAVTASEINLLLEMDTNSKAKKQLMQKKQETVPALSAADKEEMIARSMNEVVMKTGWEKPVESNPLSQKLQKELDRLEKEKTSAEDAEKWKELENQRLLHLKTMLETSRQVNNCRVAELAKGIAELQEERDKYYASCQALELQCKAVFKLLDDGDTLLGSSLS